MKQEKQDGHAEGNRVIQYNTIKVRLCPTPEQEELFQKTFGCCRYIWNQMLSDHERFYEETDAHFIPTPAKYKKGAPFLKEVDNQALTQEYNRLGQYILNEYIERGYYQTHIGHLVKHYAHKRDLLCQCLDGIADKGITYTKPRGGLLLWCDLEERINERRLYHEAESRGLLIMPGFLFYPKGYEGGGHVRLCFSNISDADIERGVQILSEALEHSVE